MTKTASSFDQIKNTKQRQPTANAQYCIEIPNNLSMTDSHRISSDEGDSDTHSTIATDTDANEQQQIGGTTAGKFVCKARGLGNSHDQTAQIEVPEGATHGQVLLCNNAECTNSGRRFRYCVICKVPVAKRNFSMRHSHGIPMTFYRRKPCWTVPVDQADLVFDDNMMPRRKRDLFFPPQKEGTPHKRSKKGSVEEKWESLFLTKPDITNSDAMAEWMKSVIDVSERVASSSLTVPSSFPPQSISNLIEESILGMKPLPVMASTFVDRGSMFGNQVIHFTNEMDNTELDLLFRLAHEPHVWSFY